MTKQAPVVTAKNTKEQILQAYQDALDRLDKKETLPKEQQKIVQEKETVQKAASYSGEETLKTLSKLKAAMIDQIDAISSELDDQFNVFSTLRQAIESEKQHLKSVYDIQENAHALSALILAQSEEKKRCEEQIVLLRQSWKNDKEALELEFKENKEKLEKERQRDEEEYQYRKTIERNRDEDTYRQKREALEQELAQMKENLTKREEEIRQKEESYKKLQDQVDLFDKTLESAVTEAQKKLAAELQQKYDFETQINTKETEGQVNLLNEKIATLTAKIADQEKLIDNLSNKAETSMKQVQEIAVKALESSSKRVIAVPQHNND